MLQEARFLVDVAEETVRLTKLLETGENRHMRGQQTTGGSHRKDAAGRERADDSAYHGVALPHDRDSTGLLAGLSATPDEALRAALQDAMRKALNDDPVLKRELTQLVGVSCRELDDCLHGSGLVPLPMLRGWFKFLGLQVKVTARKADGTVSDADLPTRVQLAEVDSTRLRAENAELTRQLQRLRSQIATQSKPSEIGKLERELAEAQRVEPPDKDSFVARVNGVLATTGYCFELSDGIIAKKLYVNSTEGREILLQSTSGGSRGFRRTTFNLVPYARSYVKNQANVKPRAETEDRSERKAGSLGEHLSRIRADAIGIIREHLQLISGQQVTEPAIHEIAAALKNNHLRLRLTMGDPDGKQPAIRTATFSKGMLEIETIEARVRKLRFQFWPTFDIFEPASGRGGHLTSEIAKKGGQTLAQGASPGYFKELRKRRKNW